MKKLPFAITLEVGSSHANQTGSWRVERPVYVDRMPPCNNACPAGENIQQWLYDAESGDYESRVAPTRRGQSLPRGHGANLLSPVRDVVQSRAARRGRGHQLHRTIPRRSRDRARLALPAPGADTDKRVLVVGAGPSGAQLRLPPSPARPPVQLVDAATKLGGMMRYGIPAYRLPRDVLDAEIERIVDLGMDVEFESHRPRHRTRTPTRAASTPCSSAWAPNWRDASPSLGRFRPDPRCRVVSPQRRRR